MLNTNSEVTFTYVLWPGLYATQVSESVCEAWSEVVARLTTHVRLLDKTTSKGFGPYSLRLGGTRKDADVEGVTLAVFDVDIGTPDQVEECRRALKGVAQIWYSTHSHRPDKPSWRLVLPLSKPVPPNSWNAFRRGLLSRYLIPADPAKCAGASHYYHLPSCAPGGEPIAFSVAGAVVVVPNVIQRVLPTPKLAADWAPPDGKEDPPAQLLRDSLLAASRRMKRRSDNRVQHKGELIARCLAGGTLAGHGERHHAMMTLTSAIVHALPPVSISGLLDIIRPSLEAMRDEGSTLNEARVAGMLERAIRYKAEQDEFANIFTRRIEATKQRAKEQGCVKREA